MNDFQGVKFEGKFNIKLLFLKGGYFVYHTFLVPGSKIMLISSFWEANSITSGHKSKFPFRGYFTPQIPLCRFLNRVCWTNSHLIAISNFSQLPSPHGYPESDSLGLLLSLSNDSDESHPQTPASMQISLYYSDWKTIS